MKILVAEDDIVSAQLLDKVLTRWGYQVSLVADGGAALDALEQTDAPSLVILDWMMPLCDGLTVCRHIRERDSHTAQYAPYIIMLTAKATREDMIEALNAGADDYLTKPLDQAELRARLSVAQRTLRLQHALAERIASLEEALGKVRQLQALLPVCSYCKRVRDDNDYWQQLDTYIATHTETQISHGICPHCYDHIVRPQLEESRYEKL